MMTGGFLTYVLSLAATGLGATGRTTFLVPPDAAFAVPVIVLAVAPPTACFTPAFVAFWAETLLVRFLTVAALPLLVASFFAVVGLPHRRCCVFLTNNKQCNDYIIIVSSQI
jgi:hypothetical protein